MENTIDTFPRKKVAAFFFASSIEAILGLIFLLLIPSDAKNQWILGYSFPRTVLITVFLAAGFFSSWILLKLIKKSDRLEQLWARFTSKPLWITLVRFLSSIILFSLILLLFNPSIRFGNWQAQLERLLPLIWYVIFLSFQTLVLFRFTDANDTWSTFKKFIKHHRSRIITFTLVLSFLTILWGIIGITGVGVKGDWGLWVEVGVPLLTKQVFWVLCAVLGITVICELLKNKKRSNKALAWIMRYQDLWICISIWLITILIWTQIPQKSNYFYPGPYAPNYEFYPFNDAATWDMNGQDALIGQGFANGNVSMDHLGLSAFLAILHGIVGQDYDQLIIAQIILYATFPVIFYWFGKSFYSRYLGLFLAGLSIIHQVNSLASENILNLSHAKMLMTEFPTGLGLILLTVFLFLWAKKQPEKNMGYLLPVGGILGVLLLYRFNMLGMPLAIIAGIFVILWRKWKQAVFASCLILISFIVVLSPWMAHSWQATGSPFFFMGKVSSAFDADFRSPPKEEPTPISSVPSESLEIAQDFHWSDLHSIAAKRAKTVVLTEDIPGTGEVILNHFVHNFVTSVLILPVTPYFYDLEQVIYEVNPFWDRTSSGPWAGEISVFEGMLILINLVILSLGLSYGWRRWRLASLFPLGIYVAFNLFLAVARTSGGRYIVPIEWIVLLYYGLGIYQIGISLIHLMGIKIQQTEENERQVHLSVRKGIFLILPFFLFVLVMTIMDQAIPPRYPTLSKSEVVEKIASEGLLDGSDLNIDELRTFIQSQDAVAYFGRALYPRFYMGGEGEYSATKTVFSHFDFSRLAFLMIGPSDHKGILLPITQMPDDFPHPADVLVVGCLNQKILNNTVDAYVVIVEGDRGNVIYKRDPTVSLSCPFMQPVGTEN